MAAGSTFVIVGASLAGAKAAETLRTEGFDGRIVLLGAEPERPYERPALSKDYLRGTAAPGKLFVHDEGFYAEHAHRHDGDRNRRQRRGGRPRRGRAAALRPPAAGHGRRATTVGRPRR